MKKKRARATCVAGRGVKRVTKRHGGSVAEDPASRCQCCCCCVGSADPPNNLYGCSTFFPTTNLNFSLDIVMFSRSFFNTFRGQATRSAATLGRAAAPRAMMWAAGAAGALAVTATVARPTPIHLEGPVTIAGEAKTVKERSYVMIKPDGTARQLVGEIISTFEKRGYKLVGLKAIVPSEELAKE